MVLISIAVQPKPRRKGDRPGSTVQAAEAFRADSTSRLTSYLPEHGFCHARAARARDCRIEVPLALDKQGSSPDE
jgi:hypothetical protein